MLEIRIIFWSFFKKLVFHPKFQLLLYEIRAGFVQNSPNLNVNNSLTNIKLFAQENLDFP